MQIVTVETWSKTLGVRVPRGYELARQLPPGVRIELGRQIRIDQEGFQKWIKEGGKFECIRTNEQVEAA